MGDFTVRGRRVVVVGAALSGQQNASPRIHITLVTPNNKVIGEAAIDGVLESPAAMRKYRALVRQTG